MLLHNLKLISFVVEIFSPPIARAPLGAFPGGRGCVVCVCDSLVSSFMFIFAPIVVSSVGGANCCVRARKSKVAGRHRACCSKVFALMKSDSRVE